jgi:hypothetical protein
MSFKEWLELDEKDNRGGDRYKTFASHIRNHMTRSMNKFKNPYKNLFKGVFKVKNI